MPVRDSNIRNRGFTKRPTITLTRKLLTQLEEVADINGIGVSSVIRQAITLGLPAAKQAELEERGQQREKTQRATAHKRTSVALTTELLAELKDVASINGITLYSVMRKAIILGLPAAKQAELEELERRRDHAARAAARKRKR
ncbi:MAG: hypothetical protein OXI15_02240 [Chromatiales bacterium]|nr:hypothetical protein [Chromatiales bacterium]